MTPSGIPAATNPMKAGTARQEQPERMAVLREQRGSWAYFSVSADQLRALRELLV